MKEAKTAAAAIKRTTKKNASGSSTQSRMKDGNKSKMVSGSNDMRGDSTRKKIDEKTRIKEATFIVLQKNEINALK